MKKKYLHLSNSDRVMYSSANSYPNEDGLGPYEVYRAWATASDDLFEAYMVLSEISYPIAQAILALRKIVEEERETAFEIFSKHA